MGYWLFVSVYFITLVSSIILSTGWIPTVFLAVLAPIMFRVVYRLNSIILKKINKKRLFIVAGVFGFIMICLVVVTVVLTFLFSDNLNLAVNASKTIENGNIELSIGKLKGNYELADFEVYGAGLILIPYQATVGEGTISLLVKKDSEIFWEESISVSGQGNIEFQSDVGMYDIEISTEEASDIRVEISSP